jgi:P-type conjugative transfer protein TrbJ
LVTMAVGIDLTAAQAGSVAGNGGATEVTQTLNNYELVTQSAQMYTQVQQSLQQVQMEQQQLQNLIAAPQQLWGQAQQDLGNLVQLVSKTQAIAYSAGNIDQQFKQSFPGYAASAGSTNYGQQYSSWIQKSLDGLNTALQAAGLNTSQFATEQSAMDQIQNLSAGSPGSLQAVQAGNMIASQTVQQLQKMRQLLANQTMAQTNYLATQQQIKADQTDAAQTFLRQGNGQVRQPNQSGYKSF